MNRLDMETRTRVISALVEGCSLRAVCRMTGVAMNTVPKLLAELGDACDDYQDKALRGLAVKRVQCDEIWACCYAKDRNIPDRLKDDPNVGSIWTWVAIDADTKLIVTYDVGGRDQKCANRFMLDVASRVTGRVQLTTDAHRPYDWAVALAFEDGEVDYAQLIKRYAGVDTGRADAKYRPPVCCSVEARVKQGAPELDHVSTSFVERQNLTMRMAMRRYTRLTNGHSKKAQNHIAATSLHFMHYNFCRPHQTLSNGAQRVTPAMAAGVTHRVWTIADQIALLGERVGRVRKIGAPPESERRLIAGMPARYSRVRSIDSARIARARLPGAILARRSSLCGLHQRQPARASREAIGELPGGVTLQDTGGWHGNCEAPGCVPATWE